MLPAQWNKKIPVQMKFFLNNDELIQGMIVLYLVKSESSLTGNGVLQGSFCSPLISGSTTVSTVRDTEEVGKWAKPSAPEFLFKRHVKLLKGTVNVISSEPPFIE